MLFEFEGELGVPASRCLCRGLTIFSQPTPSQQEDSGSAKQCSRLLRHGVNEGVVPRFNQPLGHIVDLFRIGKELYRSKRVVILHRFQDSVDTGLSKEVTAQTEAVESTTRRDNKVADCRCRPLSQAGHGYAKGLEMRIVEARE